MHLRCSAMLGASFLLILIGCNSQDPNKNTVTGKVTYKGEPIPLGKITFYDNNSKVVASGGIASGAYRMENVPQGPVKIGITVPPPIPHDQNAPPPTTALAGPQPKSIALPLKYATPGSSGLSYTVKQGEQTHDIALTP